MVLSDMLTHKIPSLVRFCSSSDQRLLLHTSANEPRSQGGGSVFTTSCHSCTIPIKIHDVAGSSGKRTEWFASRISGWVFAICSRYLATLLSSRSAMAVGVCACLKAEIFNPFLGFNAKFRPYIVTMMMRPCTEEVKVKER